LIRGLRIRRAAASDAAAVVRLLTAQLRGLGVFTPESEIASAVGGMLREGSRGFILLATLRGIPIGVAYVSFIWTLEHGGHSAWLEELYVVPEHRGRGTGRRLLLSAIRDARKHGCRALDLEVERRHPRAAPLYRREGFVRLDRSRWALRLKRRAGNVGD
jgi:GNAT superfamily N-acetyltransferase